MKYSIVTKEVFLSEMKDWTITWSKDIDKTSFVEHLKNFKSTGIENPNINYGFSTLSTGSFEKLILEFNCSCE